MFFQKVSFVSVVKYLNPSLFASSDNGETLPIIANIVAREGGAKSFKINTAYAARLRLPLMFECEWINCSALASHICCHQKRGDTRHVYTSTVISNEFDDHKT